MYKQVRLTDTVEVPPRHLADVTPQRVKRLLQDKLEGRMDEDVGSVVRVVRVHEAGSAEALQSLAHDVGDDDGADVADVLVYPTFESTMSVSIVLRWRHYRESSGGDVAGVLYYATFMSH